MSFFFWVVTDSAKFKSSDADKEERNGFWKLLAHGELLLFSFCSFRLVGEDSACLVLLASHSTLTHPPGLGEV